MKRGIAATIVAVMMGMMAASATGQTITYFTKDYIIAERRGYEVTFTRFNESRAVAAKRTEQEVARLNQEAMTSRQANAMTDKELKSLQAKLTGLKSKMTQTKDEAGKAEIQKQISELEGQIKEKEGQFLFVVQWQLSGALNPGPESEAWANNITRRVKAEQIAAEAQTAAKQKAEELKKQREEEAAKKAADKAAADKAAADKTAADKAAEDKKTEEGPKN